jgi:hypothetical protein
MDPAHAGEAGHRLALGSARRLDPLARPAVVAEVPAGPDHPARVIPPERRQLAVDGGDRRRRSARPSGVAPRAIVSSPSCDSAHARGRRRAWRRSRPPPASLRARSTSPSAAAISLRASAGSRPHSWCRRAEPLGTPDPARRDRQPARHGRVASEIDRQIRGPLLAAVARWALNACPGRRPSSGWPAKARARARGRRRSAPRSAADSRSNASIQAWLRSPRGRPRADRRRGWRPG